MQVLDDRQFPTLIVFCPAIGEADQLTSEDLMVIVQTLMPAG